MKHLCHAAVILFATIEEDHEIYRADATRVICRTGGWKIKTVFINGEMTLSLELTRPCNNPQTRHKHSTAQHAWPSRQWLFLQKLMVFAAQIWPECVLEWKLALNHKYLSY